MFRRNVNKPTGSRLKLGIKMPKTSWEWEAANGHFQAAISNQPIESDHLGWHIRNFNDVIYDYFKTNYGVINSPNNAGFSSKDKGQSVKDLKVTRRKLKSRGNDVNEIEFVAKLVRTKPKDKRPVDSLQEHPTQGQTINHDKYISRDVWWYVKNVLQYEAKLSLPLTDQSVSTISTKPSRLVTQKKYFPFLTGLLVYLLLRSPLITNLLRTSKSRM